MRLGLGMGLSKPMFNSGAEFISTWKTDNSGTSNNDQITLPLELGGTYNFKVDWGDSSSDTITAYNDPAVTHTYTLVGTYTVKISGQIEGWRFANGGDRRKITDVSQWGNLIVGDNNGYFSGCNQMTVSAKDELDVSGVTDMLRAFRYCLGMTVLKTTNWNVSSVNSLEEAFRGCTALATLDVSNWDISSVTRFDYCFYDCQDLTALDVSSWNTGLVTTFNRTFYRCGLLTTLDVSSWDASSIQDITYMYYNTDGLSSSDYGGIKNWDITSLTTAGSFMRYSTNTLTTADYDTLLVNWEGQSVQNNVLINFNGAQYTSGGAAETARTALINDHSWTITDGGAAP
tara:strand:- start:53 stop:1084 length:1032 start_codon:yes stop_codon:yes gene_type:complete